MKKCFKCGEEKARSEFYRHPQMGDGLLGKCKSCAKADVIKHRGENLEKIRAYDRKRGNRQTVEYGRKYKKVYKRKYPVAVMAHKIFKSALGKGQIKKEPCLVCYSDRSQAHHDDYRKPLDVIWYCSLHHMERHAVIRRLGIDLHSSF